jgi:nitrogen fixation/metabolism regulation signal transduction histidine kinase
MSTSAAPSIESTGPHKRSVRNFLLDSRFQLKYSGLLVLVAVAISGVMGAVLYTTTRAMVEESTKVVEQSRKVSEESRKVSEISRMNIGEIAADSPELMAVFSSEADAHDRTIAEQERAIAENQGMLLHRQRVVIASLTLGLALLVLAIGLLGIYFTHKVAGPVYKMKRLLKQVGKGSLRVEARLRRGDELQDFFDAFTQMVAGLRDMEKRQLDEVDAALDALGRGAKDEAKAALGRIREEMKGALER